jgi:hypothetical protein
MFTLCLIKRVLAVQLILRRLDHLLLELDLRFFSSLVVQYRHMDVKDT